MKNTKPKIIVVLGQTATGKSDLAVKLATKIDDLKRSSGSFGPRATVHGLARTSRSEVLGEIISADSRQVYKTLDIGTGKITKKEMRGVPHHLLDVVSPKNQFTVAEYKKLADKKISEIIERGKVPILVGGTGFYIQAVVDGIIPPKVPPNTELRKKLSKKSAKELLKMLEKLDPERAMSIEQKNPRRLIRAIEIARALGKVPKIKKVQKYDVLQIGLQIDDKELKERILKRLFARIKEPKSSSKIGQSMIKEAKKLHNPPAGGGLSWKRMEELGLEYRYLARYLQGKLSTDEMIEQLNTAIWHYAKRQKTWFKRDKRIYWFNPTEIKKIEKLVRKFFSTM